MTLVRRLRAIGNHPLNCSNRLRAFARVLRWQTGSRILAHPAIVPFTEHTRLVVSRGMTGATGNIYCGLHDFEDMCFLLHFLRPDDTFVDVGANVGTYTVLASGEAGARSISIEPLPATFQHLMDNIYLNRLNDRVAAHNCGIGSDDTKLSFTSGRDTTNQVLSASSKAADVPTIEIAVRTLDSVASSHSVNMLKVDVEGFEWSVIQGAKTVLASKSLSAVVIELNGSGRRYGFDDNMIHQRMLDYEFRPFSYEPFGRHLNELPGRNAFARNTLYLRNLDEIQEKVANARAIALPWRMV